MTRTVWVVMIGIALVLGIVAGIANKKEPTKPQQELARAVLAPANTKLRVIVPPCGTGVPVATQTGDQLAKTPGSVVFLLNANPSGREVVVPRCRASQGAQPSEGVNLPAAAFILPIAANETAGRAGSAEAGTERVQSTVQPLPGINTIIVGGCIESKQQAEKTATGRTIVVKPVHGRPTEALAPPC
jgi:hypothetical protein